MTLSSHVDLWALLPVKPFAEAKSRLAPQLNPEERSGLASALLERTVLMLKSGMPSLSIMIVSRDPAVADKAREYGVRFVPEPHLPDSEAEGEARLNRALTRGAAVAKDEGAEALLVLPTDLPRLYPRDVEALILALGNGVSLALAPSYSGGTNGMLLSPPDLIPFSFGEGSFERHLALARRASATVEIVHSPGLAFDLDRPGDLTKFRAESHS